MQINNFDEVKEIITNAVVEHNGERKQLTINGEGKFFRNNNSVSSFQVLFEIKELVDILNELNTIFYRYEKQLKEIINEA